MTFPRLPVLLIALLPVLPAALAAQQAGNTPPPVDSDTLPDMAAIEQAWARGDFVFVRQGLQRLAEETDSVLAQYRYGRVLLEGRGGPRDLGAARDWLEKAAARKYAPAETLLARLYLSASSDSPNYQPDRAVRLFASAAARGTVEAQYYLGLMLREGTGVEADPEAAFNWFLAAAEQQYAPAQYELSRAYSRGQGVEGSAAEALNWLTRAAENGHVEAQFFLARALDTGQGAPQNRAEATAWLTRAAEAGYAPAKRSLGRRYLLGDGAEANPQEALRWLSEAAAGEDPVAMALLGDAYSGAHGLPADPDRAWAWYNKSSAYSYGRATAAMGRMLEQGVGRPVDIPAAVALYRRALSQENHADAALDLGRLAGTGQLDGLAAPHSAVPWAVAAASAGNAAALDWLRQRAQNGLRPAQTAYGIWLSDTDSDTGRDPGAAVPFFEGAAKRGDVVAQYRLGLMLTRGDGVEQDYIAAHAWLNIAAASGHPKAADMRAVVSDLMTAEEVAEAQARTRAFFEEAARTSPVGGSQ